MDSPRQSAWIFICLLTTITSSSAIPDRLQQTVSKDPHMHTSSSTITNYAIQNVSTVVFKDGENNLDMHTSFKLQHPDLTSPGSDHWFTWVYGDGERDEDMQMSTFTRPHRYPFRGVYEGYVTIMIKLTNGTVSEFTSLNFTAEVGQLQVKLSSIVVMPLNTTKTIEWSCSECAGATYSSETRDIASTPGLPFVVTYSQLGNFRHEIVTDSGLDLVSFTVVIRRGPWRHALTLELLPSSDKAYIRDEAIDFQLSFTRSIYETITCIIDYGDYSFIAMQQSSNMTFKHEYYAPGLYNATGYCFNDADFSQSNTVVVDVGTSLARLTMTTSPPFATVNSTPNLTVLLNADHGIPTLIVDSISSNHPLAPTLFLYLFLPVEAGINKLGSFDHFSSLPAGTHDLVMSVREEPMSTPFQLPVFKLVVAEKLEIFVATDFSDTELFPEVEFHITFANLPVHEFGYIIDLGDGIQPPLIYRPSDFARVSTFTNPLTFEYLHEGAYVINVTVFNDVVSSSTIIPINVSGWELTLSRNETVVMEESQVTFKILYSRNFTPKSTSTLNMSCSLSVENSSLVSFPSVVDVYLPLTINLPWMVTFPQNGTYLVALVCAGHKTQSRWHKRGQSRELKRGQSRELNVTVVDYTESDYLLHFEEAIPINGTVNTVNSKPTLFRLALFDIETPFEHETIWSFGDGSLPSVVRLSNWTVEHLYEKRGVYSGHVTISTPRGQFINTFTVYVGISRMLVKPDAAVLGSNVLVECWEIRGKVSSIIISYGDASPETETVTERFSVPYTYAFAGWFEIKTLITLESLTEEVVYDKAVFIDHVPNNLYIHMEKNNIIQPPGVLDMEVWMRPEGNSVRYMNCVIDYDDVLDQRLRFSVRGLMAGMYFIDSWSYIAFGTHSISVNCSNLLGFYVALGNCTVQSACFSDHGIFEDRYANPNTPLYITSSANVLITSRVNILCNVSRIQFKWYLFTLDWGTSEPDRNISIDQPEKDTFPIDRGSLDTNTTIYRLCLNISMEYGTEHPWLYGLTYIKVFSSPLIAQFTGGALRTTGLDLTKIDARALSYDPDLGFENKDPLIFQWECREYNSSKNIENLKQMISESIVGTVVRCDHISTEIEDGVRQLNNIPDDPRGYSFKVTVSTMDKEPVHAYSYIQYTREAPVVVIECVINCKSKTAITTDLTMEMKCPYCSSEEFDTADVTWTLMKDVSKNKSYVVPNFHTYTYMLEDNPASIIILKNSLEPCANYTLRVSVKISSRKEEGQSEKNIFMNCPPKDGDCRTEPTFGDAKNTSFQTSCSGWRDEGFENSLRNVPLIYKFYISQGDLLLPIFEGPESVSPNTTLPIIPGSKGGKYNIMIRIYDVLDDYTEVNNTIDLVVKSLVSLSEADEAKKTGMSSTLQGTTSDLTTQLFETTYLSSIYQTVEFVSLDSFLDEYVKGNDEQSQASTLETSLNDVWSSFMQRVLDTGKRDLAKRYKELTAQINQSVPDIATLNGHGLAALGEALTMFIFSKDTTDFETVNMVIELVDSGASALERITNQVLYPFGEKVDQAVHGLMGALDRILEKNSPSYTTNDATIVFKAGGIKQEGAALIKSRILEQKFREDNEIIIKSREAMPMVESTIRKILNSMQESLVSGQKAKYLRREGITFTTSKSTARTLTDKENELDEYSFIFPEYFNGTVKENEQVILKTSVTKKNPYGWASDHSSFDITSPILSIAMETMMGTSLFAGNVSIKLKRPELEFHLYQVSDTRVGEDQFCHHQFQLKRRSEMVFIFIDLGGHLGEVKGYFRHGLPPTTYSPNVEVRIGKYMSVNTSSGHRVMIKFELQPNEMPVGLIYIGIDFRNLTVNISEYSLLAYTDSCRVWDRKENIWSDSSCKVSPYSTPYQTICDCKDAPGCNFASTFYVPPNLINFKMVFSKFVAQNAAVYGTILGLFFVFGLAMVWAYKMDIQDDKKWKVGYLKDNIVGDHYLYLLTVHTGLGGSSGTRSQVSFILTGSKGNTGVRSLSDSHRHLETGTVMTFIMTTKQSLGELIYLRIWHDNSGEGSYQSWFLYKIYVEDIHTNTRTLFFCNRWLAVDKGDGLIDRVLIGSGSYFDDSMTFSKLFAEHSRINISDSHLWMSIFLRPERSMFTRLQRVTCCLLTLLLAMISSALFYQPEDVEGNSQNEQLTEFRIGLLRFSTITMFTSSVGILITVPPILLIVCLFKSRRPWVKRTFCCGLRKAKQQQPDTMQNYQCETGQRQHQNSANNREDPLIAKFHKNPLPWWCLIVAWTLLMTGILTSAFAIVLYSMQWGKTVSEQWLASFVLSLFESIFILDPIKVLVLSALFAICMKNPAGDNNSTLAIDEIGQQSQLHGCDEFDISLLPPEPISKEDLQKVRKRRREENIANGVFVELLLYIIFIFCLFSVSYVNRDGRSYLLNNHLQNTLTKVPFRKAPQMYYGTEKETFTWFQMKQLDDIYTWLNETMVDAMLPWKDLAGNILPSEQRTFISDLANYRLGPIRVRQVRMPREIPQPIKSNPTFVGPKISNQENLVGTLPRCTGYDMNNELRESYCLGWQPGPCTYVVTPITSAAWTYKSSAEEGTSPVVGKFAVYSGSAYVVDLIFSRDILRHTYFQELKDNHWLDVQTKAVFVDFTLFNVNLNLFTGVRLAVEVPQYGGLSKWIEIKPKRLYEHVGAQGLYVLICQVFMACMALLFIVKLIRKVLRQKISFFYDIWNHFDILIVFLVVAAIVFYILRKISFSTAIECFKKDPKVFVNLQKTFLYDDIYGWLLGAMVFLCTLRLMRILGYNKRITMIAAVLRVSSPDLFSFGALFINSTTAFALTGYILFHVNLDSFMTVWDSYVTLIYLLLGKNVFKQMVLVSAISSRIYFFVLAVAIVWFVMTIFQAILNESASQVRLDVSNAPSPYGVMDVINNIYRSIVLDNRMVEFIKRKVSKPEKKSSPKEDTIVPSTISHAHKVLSIIRTNIFSSIEVNDTTKRTGTTVCVGKTKEYESDLQGDENMSESPGLSLPRSRSVTDDHETSRLFDQARQKDKEKSQYPPSVWRTMPLDIPQVMGNHCTNQRPSKRHGMTRSVTLGPHREQPFAVLLDEVEPNDRLPSVFRRANVEDF